MMNYVIFYPVFQFQPLLWELSKSKNMNISTRNQIERFNCIQTECFGSVTVFDLSTVLSNMQPREPRYGDNIFDGICVDSGAQISVCGKRQAHTYCPMVNIPFIVRQSSLNFKFGDMVTRSLGKMKFRFPCSNGGSLDMDIDIVDLDVPLLLGLRELRCHRLRLDYLSNTLENKQLRWRVNLQDKYGHLYWNLQYYESFYTRAEIERLDRHFFHPSAENYTTFFVHKILDKLLQISGK